MFFACAEIVFADAKSQIEKVNKMDKNTNDFSIQKIKTQTQTTQNTKKDKQQKKHLTNYQYDDRNYKYYRIKKYIKSNIEYSKTGSTLVER